MILVSVHIAIRLATQCGTTPRFVTAEKTQKELTDFMMCLSSHTWKNFNLMMKMHRDLLSLKVIARIERQKMGKGFG